MGGSYDVETVRARPLHSSGSGAGADLLSGIDGHDCRARRGENYALIVTASDYPNLDEKYWLKGPKNDAVLVRDYLVGNAPVKFEPGNVTTLGSGDGLELATHATILAQLGQIADKAKPGDFVFLQFSGTRLAAAGDHRQHRGGRPRRDLPRRRYEDGRQGQAVHAQRA